MTQSLESALWKQAEAQQKLAASLVGIPGGRDLVDWFDGRPEFGDAEVVSLLLDRRGPSTLRIALELHGKSATVTFKMTGWIDTEVRGFSKQNVLGGLKLQRADHRTMQPWELGVGCQPGAWLIELRPCFGAYGMIRADIAQIIVERIPARPGGS